MRIMRIAIALALVGGVAVLLTQLGSGPEQVASAKPMKRMTSADCAGCHTEIGKEHALSWHGQAFTDPAALQLTENFQKPECVSCHAPTLVLEHFGERVFSRNERREEGVNCVSCHMRPDGRVAGVRGLTGPCNPIEDKRIAAAQFCAPCHDQHKTVQEFLAWKVETGREESCNDCHMAREDRPLVEGGPVREGVATHLMQGSHFPEMLKKAVTLEAVVRDGRLVISVTNSGAGHKVPTDSRHKSYNVLVTIEDHRGNVLTDREEVAEYRLYYRDQKKESTQIEPGETRVHTFELPADVKGRAVVEVVYCMKPPEKLTREWTPVHRLELDF